MRILEDEEDINQITDFFSYEHFYVIYCKFWELDKDHDLYISKEDLARHNDHGELIIQGECNYSLVYQLTALLQLSYPFLGIYWHWHNGYSLS